MSVTQSNLSSQMQALSSIIRVHPVSLQREVVLTKELIQYQSMKRATGPQITTTVFLNLKVLSQEVAF